MILKEILQYLIETQIPIREVKTFSKLPGIYAFSFIGENFPLGGFSVPENRIIYIGKTESSQQSRDANTHFKTGRTGSSTVRKSIGALLSQTEKINPIIRSASDVVKGRTSHFKYDQSSEEKITEWMFKNLAVAFYEYPQGKEAISSLETNLIQYLKPVLNIDGKNNDNPYKSDIKKLRKDLGTAAHSKSKISHATTTISQDKRKILKTSIDYLQTEKSFIIPSVGNRITEKDIERSTIRITTEFKRFFPITNSSVNIKIGDYSENVQYQIKEGKSSLLKLGVNIISKLNLKQDNSIKIEIRGLYYHLSKL